MKQVVKSFIGDATITMHEADRNSHDRFHVNVTRDDGSFECGTSACYQEALGQVSLAFNSELAKLTEDMRKAHTFNEDRTPMYPELNEKYYMEVA